MNGNEFSLRMYKMKDWQGCLKMKVAGRYYTVCRILEPLKFVGWLEQLARAINTGAPQQSSYVLMTANGRECVVFCEYQQQVSLKLDFRGRTICNWLGPVWLFSNALKVLVKRLPKFF